MLCTEFCQRILLTEFLHGVETSPHGARGSCAGHSVLSPFHSKFFPQLQYQQNENIFQPWPLTIAGLLIWSSFSPPKGIDMSIFPLPFLFLYRFVLLSIQSLLFFLLEECSGEKCYWWGLIKQINELRQLNSKWEESEEWNWYLLIDCEVEEFKPQGYLKELAVLPREGKRGLELHIFFFFSKE